MQTTTVDVEVSAKEKSVLTMKGIFLSAVLMAKRSLGQFMFYEDKCAKKGNDKWVLLAKYVNPAIFYIPCTVTGLHVTAAGAVQQRKPNTSTDEYSVRVIIEEEKLLEEIKAGFDEAVQKLKQTPDASASIAVGAGLVEKKSCFSVEETGIINKVSNVVRDTVYFNRKVAGPRDPSINLDEAPNFFSVYPKQKTQYLKLQFPARYHLNPLIPVVGNDGVPVTVETVELPCKGIVYFELNQAAYNFNGLTGPLRPIVLIPSDIAVRLEPPIHQPPTFASLAKRRRLCF